MCSEMCVAQDVVKQITVIYAFVVSRKLKDRIPLYTSIFDVLMCLLYNKRRNNKFNVQHNCLHNLFLLINTVTSRLRHAVEYN